MNNPYVILTDAKEPLMVREKLCIPKIGQQLQASFEELIGLQRRLAEPGCPWGYFPGWENGESGKYPQTITLSERLRHAVDPSFILAFIRASEAEVSAVFGGLHLDVNVEVTYPKPDPSFHIIRYLINLHDYPRVLEIARVTAQELIAEGTLRSTDRYQTLELPDKYRRERIEIPGRANDMFHAIKFWSDIVPHVGRTDENGHFLVSYGKYVDSSNRFENSTFQCTTSGGRLKKTSLGVR